MGTSHYIQKIHENRNGKVEDKMRFTIDPEDRIWRDLLSPSESGMIDSGKYDLVLIDNYYKRGQRLNIDSLIPHSKKGETNSQEPVFYIHIRPRRIQSIWTENYPEMRNMAFFFIVEKNEDDSKEIYDNKLDLCRKVIEKMRKGGFVAAGFKEYQSFCDYNTEHEFFKRVNAYSVIGNCFNNYEETKNKYDTLSNKFHQKKVLLGCSIPQNTDRDKKVFNYFLPSSINLSNAKDIELICEHVIRTFDYDIKRYSTFQNSSFFDDSSEKKKLINKIEELHKIIHPAINDLSNFDKGFMEFLRQSGTGGRLKPSVIVSEILCKVSYLGGFATNLSRILYKNHLDNDSISFLDALKKSFDLGEYLLYVN